MANTKVVIWMGQSNSQGAMAMASLQAGYKQTYNNIKIWNIDNQNFASLNYAVNNNQWPSSQKINCFGSEFAVLTNLQSHWGGTVYGITYSVGGTELGTALDSTNNWNTATSGSYFTLALDQVNRAIAYMWNTLKLQNQYDFYFIWEQGEQDCKSVTDKNNYQTNITNFKNAMMNNLSGTAFANSKKIFIIPRVDTLIVSKQDSATICSNATNANPIVITVPGGHGLTTGREAYFYGFVGNTAMNGNKYTVTVTNSTTLSIPVVGNGAYVSGGYINQFCYPSDIATAQSNISDNISVFTYSTDSYSLQSDNTHFDATGYDNKGVDLVNNIIIANNL